MASTNPSSTFLSFLVQEQSSLCLTLSLHLNLRARLQLLYKFWFLLPIFSALLSTYQLLSFTSFFDKHTSHSKAGQQIHFCTCTCNQPLLRYPWEIPFMKIFNLSLILYSLRIYLTHENINFNHVHMLHFWPHIFCSTCKRCPKHLAPIFDSPCVLQALSKAAHVLPDVEHCDISNNFIALYKCPDLARISTIHV